MLMIQWLSTRSHFESYVPRAASLLPETNAASNPAIRLYCDICKTTRDDCATSSGASFDGRPNLREGMICSGCRLNARQRLLLMALLESAPAGVATKGALLERLSRLYRRTRHAYPNVTGSEFLDVTKKSGRHYLWFGQGRSRFLPRFIRQESITALSFPTGSLDFIAHSDVLEHVHDTRQALLECKRVLRPGGVCIFTAPFFTAIDKTVIRGTIDDKGVLVELEPTELHGDGIHGAGAYTFYNFGWDFFDLASDIFGDVEIGWLHDPRQGFFYADSVPSAWNMGPIVFRARNQKP